MKALVLGGSGMLGHKVFQVLSDSFEVFATTRGPDGPWRTFPMYQRGDRVLGGVDALEVATVRRALDAVRPEVVINCIGIVKQRPEGEDPIQSIAINALFPHQLAAQCADIGARLIHVSTDCVFSGRKGHYTEQDQPDPVDLYGRTKLLGEAMGRRCLTIRTSVFGRDFQSDRGLLEWFVSQRGKTVDGYVNAIYTGFPTRTFARILSSILADYPELSGVYHVASEPISKCDLLMRIRRAMDLDVHIIPTKTPRVDRSLDATQFRDATGYGFPTWEEMIKELVEDDTPYDDWRKRYGSPRR